MILIAWMKETLVECVGFHQLTARFIETVKINGSWAILDEVEELIIPEDLDPDAHILTSRDRRQATGS
jgi:hypothetical protein